MRLTHDRRFFLAFVLLAVFASVSPGHLIPGSRLAAAPPENAIWTNTINTTANGPTVSKTSGADDVYNASAITQQALTGNGIVHFSAPASVSHKVGVGLGTDPSANVWMPFGILFGGSVAVAEVREAGTYKGEIAWQPGDTFELEVFNGNQVRYRKNGTVFYTSQATATLPLQLDAIISTVNASVANVTFDVESTAAVWTNTINTTATGSAIAKTSGTDDVYNASAITQQSLTGNGRVRFTVPTSVTHKVQFGLSNDPSANVPMPFSLLFGGSLPVVDVRENGTYRTDTGWQPGDVFEIEIFNASQVRYSKNGTVFYTSQATATLPLKGDVIIATLNAGVTNVAVVGGSGTPPTTPPGNAPQTYNLRTDTAVIGTGPATAPSIGPSGSMVIDSEFSTRITRVTDTATATDGRPWGTPSAPNLNMISSDDRTFYVVSDDGSTVLIYNFDPATGAFTLNHQTSFVNEPNFSRKIEKPNILYGVYYNYTVVAYDVSTQVRSAPLITLTNEVGPMDPNTQFASVVYSSQGTPERLAISYGATQDLHQYMTVFDADTPANRMTINTRTSQIRVNGGAWEPLLTPSGAPANINFGLHSISIDRSGKWVKLDLADAQAGAAHTALFNVETHRIHEWTSDAWLGHYALGWEAHVSCIADPNGGGTYQWLFTDLTQPGLPPPWRPLITPPPPANSQLTTDHTSWNNARSDLLVPVISGTQRAIGGTEWARWYDEIVAVATAPNPPAQVYRAGRHYMALYNASGTLVYTFRDSPRPQVTHNGMWTFFTSNWGLTLGTYGSGTSNQRRDVFVVRMARE